MKKAFIFIFTGLGLVLTFLLIIGATNDFASFDRTKGGYEPPYEGYTGEPIDWDEGDLTKTGMVRRGKVINTLFNCTSGMISFEIYGKQIEFRVVSERGIKVHKPRKRAWKEDFNRRFE